jgi:hypothetical protein
LAGELVWSHQGQVLMQMQIITWLILGRSESFLPLINAYNNSVFSFTFSVHITCNTKKMLSKSYVHLTRLSNHLLCQ